MKTPEVFKEDWANLLGEGAPSCTTIMHNKLEGQLQDFQRAQLHVCDVKHKNNKI